MEHCILFRTPNGRVGFVCNPEDESTIAVYPGIDAAVAAAEVIPACRIYPYQVVCLDEL